MHVHFVGLHNLLVRAIDDTVRIGTEGVGGIGVVCTPTAGSAGLNRRSTRVARVVAIGARIVAVVVPAEWGACAVARGAGVASAFGRRTCASSLVPCSGSAVL